MALIEKSFGKRGRLRPVKGPAFLWAALGGKRHSHSNESDKVWHRNKRAPASRPALKKKRVEKKGKSKHERAPPFVKLTRVWRSAAWFSPGVM